MRVDGSEGESRYPPAGILGAAAAVAAAVGAILPEGFSCGAHDATVILVRGHVGVRSLDLADAPEWRADTWADDLRMVLWQVLSDFQDAIVEHLGQAWPALPGATGIAVPHARIEEGVVRAWYGTDDAVMVAMRPISSRPDSEEGGDATDLM